jgi:DNA-directed RNA polymerase specialized sigma24 family protein
MTSDDYGEAYQRGYNLTVRLLLSRGVAPEPARETAQAAWVKGWEHVGQLRDEKLVVNWVNSIALNLYRSVRRQPVFQELPELRTGPGVNLAAIDLELILKVCRPADRVLLEEQVRGMTAEEIARQKGVTETAIRIRWMRARRSARRRVIRRAAGLRDLHSAAAADVGP